ncbi:nuclear transport factor 2-like protein [Alteribacillus iranensis]|uniref:SnoaL-like domain-containing protein n=1 Tax=Alteribacillus iranensis TaxID=930128 RepID=A0A1I2DTD6_9BACI|nr:nuclear transport factor 2 family protein [Alteribacillus iranensis]SFE83825.1 SnoaL-like domain-containing protein [Alteribacillus iranensis]
MKVICEENCGNAPKKQLLKDFNIAFAKCDVESIIEQVSDDIIWHMVEDKKVNGKEEFAKELELIDDEQATELHIEHIITMGIQLQRMAC